MKEKGAAKERGKIRQVEQKHNIKKKKFTITIKELKQRLIAKIAKSKN